MGGKRERDMVFMFIFTCSGIRILHTHEQETDHTCTLQVPGTENFGLARFISYTKRKNLRDLGLLYYIS